MKEFSDKILITADEVILFEGQIREKPENDEENINWLKSYSNNYLTAINGVCVRNNKTGQQVAENNVAKIYFNEINDEMIKTLLEDGGCRFCCGGFKIELMREAIKMIDKHEDSILGLPHQLIKILINKLI